MSKRTNKVKPTAKEEEPTLEKIYALEEFKKIGRGILPFEMIMELGDECSRAIVKFEGKEKVITRDDFKDKTGIDSPPVEEVIKQYKMLSCGDQRTISEIMQGFLKLRAECFDEEPKKTMTLREAIELKLGFKFMDNEYAYCSALGNYVWYAKENNRPYHLDLTAFIYGLDTKVEII